MSDKTPSDIVKDLPETTTLRRMKRSRMLHVSGLMATVGFTMAACDAPSAPPPQPETPTLAYSSVAECKAADDVPDDQCDAAFAQAQQSAQRYATKEECEGQWGPDQCQPNNSGGGSSFSPFLTGFIIGQMMNGNRYGGPMYRGDDRYTGARGGNTDLARRNDTDVVKKAPERVQSRTTVVSRGGFGGGGRSYGG